MLREVINELKTKYHNVGSLVEWLERRNCKHGLGSKPTRVVLLCPWERHLMALSTVWWSW